MRLLDTGRRDCKSRYTTQYCIERKKSSTQTLDQKSPSTRQEGMAQGLAVEAAGWTCHLCNYSWLCADPAWPWAPQSEARAMVWEGFTYFCHCSDMLLRGITSLCSWALYQPPPALLLASHRLQGGLWEPSPQGLSIIASQLGDSDH